MRIGMMADVYKPRVSGVTNHIALNKRYLEKAGHEVFIFTFGDLEYEDDEANVVRSPGLLLTEAEYYLGFRYKRQVKAQLQTMQVVHVHHPFISGRLALRYCRPLRIPVAFTNHTRYDLYAQAYLPLLPEEISDTLLQTYMPSFCAAVDMTISPSPGMAEVLRRLNVTAPIAIVPNGVELERYHTACGDCRDEFGLGENDILLAYAGRLGPEKNLDFLLQAFTGCAQAVENAHLLFIGGGPEEESLKEQAARSSAAQRIHFTGMIAHTDMPRRLAMCDLFVTASVTEVHPLSVIEAMAAGLPALGIQSVGVGDTIEDGLTGLLTVQDQAAFAAQMTRLCLDKPLRQKMGAAAREASEKYAVERTTGILLEHYQQLIAKTAPRRHGPGYRARTLVERLRK